MDKNRKYNFKKTSYNKLKLKTDIFGSQLFLLIKQDFIKNIKDYIPKNILLKKKNKDRIFENLFCHWYFWEAYTSKLSYHPLLLEEDFNYKSLINILSDYLKGENDNCSEKFSEIILNLDLQKKFKNAVTLLKSKKDFNCSYNIYRYDKMIKIFINSDLLNDSFIVSAKHSEKILEKLGDDDFVSLMYRYHVLSSNNNQLATNPKKLSEINPDIELFSSGFNFSCNKFCSLFPDIESKLGSLGRFQDVNILSGRYQINPPFQTTIIYDILGRIKGWIDKANIEGNYLEFHLFLPDWSKNKSNLEYSKYLVLDLANEIDGKVEVKNIKNNDFNYIDYWNDKIRNYTLPDTLYLVICNEKDEK